MVFGGVGGLGSSRISRREGCQGPSLAIHVLGLALGYHMGWAWPGTIDCYELQIAGVKATEESIRVGSGETARRLPSLTSGPLPPVLPDSPNHVLPLLLDCL